MGENRSHSCFNLWQLHSEIQRHIKRALATEGKEAVVREQKSDQGNNI